ncbi:MAG: S-methyl-5'-thioadenosine phosphorylase [Candidatus Diapherotrites archaeon]
MIGLIGGSGFYDTAMLKKTEQKKVHTPFGATSDLVTTGEFEEKKIAFIPRHGAKHSINPSQVNYRANIQAMKELGVQRIIAANAVGSLKEEMKPGELVIVDQFIDLTKGRKNTFYEGTQVCHISTAEPFCKELRKILIESAQKLSLPFHEKGTCIVIEGPRFSTKAESILFKSWGADIINMTLCPEAVLAREAEICYAAIAMVTDYDCWKDSHATGAEVVKIMKENVHKMQMLVKEAIPLIPEQRKCECKDALKSAIQ